MKLSGSLLGSAAIAAALMLIPAAYAAGIGDPYPTEVNPSPGTNPTPQDRAATEQSSEQALRKAKDAAAADAASQAQYRQAVAGQQAQTQADQAAYGREVRHYHHDLRRWAAFYGHERFVGVYGMPRNRLTGMMVASRGGTEVGRVREVETGGNGRVVRVAVTVGQGETAWIDADDLQYDPGTRTVFTDLSRDEINADAHMRYPRF